MKSGVVEVLRYDIWSYQMSVAGSERVKEIAWTYLSRPSVQKALLWETLFSPTLFNVESRCPKKNSLKISASSPNYRG
jgi:hypothetical protein